FLSTQLGKCYPIRSEIIYACFETCYLTFFSHTPILDKVLRTALAYANFKITNGVIIASEYWIEGMPESEKKKDEKLRVLLEKYFPRREIFTYDALAINCGGGGVHCRTQQEPKLIE
ncbi:MAG: agmatine deiminase family protein, partial [Bacteroidota bacterium]